jgi:hypothetical protein
VNKNDWFRDPDLAIFIEFGKLEEGGLLSAVTTNKIYRHVTMQGGGIKYRHISIFLPNQQTNFGASQNNAITSSPGNRVIYDIKIGLPGVWLNNPLT